MTGGPLDQFPDSEFERFLLFSAFLPVSIDSLRRHFPRWRGALARRGVSSIPLDLQSRDPDVGYAIACLTLLALQARTSRVEAAGEHHLRNITGTRPEKP